MKEKGFEIELQNIVNDRALLDLLHAFYIIQELDLLIDRAEEIDALEIQPGAPSTRSIITKLITYDIDPKYALLIANEIEELMNRVSKDHKNYSKHISNTKSFYIAMGKMLSEESEGQFKSKWWKPKSEHNKACGFCASGDLFDKPNPTECQIQKSIKLVAQQAYWDINFADKCLEPREDDQKFKYRSEYLLTRLEFNQCKKDIISEATDEVLYGALRRQKTELDADVIIAKAQVKIDSELLDCGIHWVLSAAAPDAEMSAAAEEILPTLQHLGESVDF